MILDKIKLSTLVLISMIVICAVNTLKIQKMKLKNKFYFDYGEKTEVPTPENGCINFYDDCNYKGNLIIKLCHWKNTSLPKIIAETTNKLIKNIKSIAFSNYTELYMDYDIDRIPQKKLILDNNVACISDLFKEPGDHKITILEVKYLGA